MTIFKHYHKPTDSEFYTLFKQSRPSDLARVLIKRDSRPEDTLQIYYEIFCSGRNLSRPQKFSLTKYYQWLDTKTMNWFLNNERIEVTPIRVLSI